MDGEESGGVVEMKVTTKKSSSFYANSAKSFILGFEDKDGNKKEPVKVLNISGLGEAITVAVAAAQAIERDHVGTIQKTETSCVEMDRQQVPRINITIMGGGPGPISRRKNGKTLVLFDVDGTLTVPAQKATDAMMALLARLRKDYAVGIVGAAHFEKQQLQLLGDLHSKFDYVFAESGVDAFRNGSQIHSKSMKQELGAERWEAFQAGLDVILLAEHAERERLLQIACPGQKLSERGTFLEKRKCTVNVTPIGRTPTLTKEQRAAYDKVDIEAGLRVRIVDAIHKQFGPDTESRLLCNIGGQIGLDIAPCGWDKTFCLQFVEEYTTVHFFGDKTSKGGGDYEIFEHPRTQGHTVKSPEDTMEQIEALFLNA